MTRMSQKRKRNIKPMRGYKVMQNGILEGIIIDYPEQKSVNRQGVAFYGFRIEVERISGKGTDKIQVIVEEGKQPCNTLADMDEAGEIIGKRVRVKGRINTRNIKVDGKSRLDVSFKAEYLDEVETSCSAKDNNCFAIDGYLCRKVTLRDTPLGLKIADLLLATSGEKYCAYIPCICWNGSAVRADNMLDIGDHIQINGRLQSRDYIKVVDGIEEQRTVMEMSIHSFQLLESTRDEETA